MVWYCDFVVLSVVEVCVNYGAVNVFHICLDFGVVYSVVVYINVYGVVCVVVWCLFLASGCCLLCLICDACGWRCSPLCVVCVFRRVDVSLCLLLF